MRILSLFKLPDQYNIDLLTEELSALPYIDDANEVTVDTMAGHYEVGVYHKEKLTVRERDEIEIVLSNHDSLGKSSTEQKQETLEITKASLRTKLTASTWTPLTSEEVDALLQ